MTMGGRVSKLSGERANRLALAVTSVLFVLMLVPAARAQVGSSPNAQARKRMAQVVERTLQDGVEAKLPPHLSTLLGLTKEAECPVKQAVMRTGKRVQGFDVSTLNQRDVVLFVVDETAGDQTLYLTSKEGVLRRLVRVKAGAGEAQKITVNDQKAFEKEKQFWLDQLAAVPASH
jgi:hypothetical protein